MKYLSEYVAEGQTKAFDKAGAFFAFSDKQFNEARKEGIEYVQLGGGLICPNTTADQLMEDLEVIHKEGIEADIKEHGIEAIIKRELSNHEAYYTSDIGSTVNALESYGITAEEVNKVFRNERVNVMD